MKIKGLMSSKFNEYETPQELYDICNSCFHFQLDVCASDKNYKHYKYLTKEDDGLHKNWANRNWMNPPYGQVIGDWIKKAYNESLKGNIVVCLIPARPDTKYWHNYCFKSNYIVFIKGRVHFLLNGKDAGPAPFPSCLVIFGDIGDIGDLEILGTVVKLPKDKRPAASVDKWIS